MVLSLPEGGVELAKAVVGHLTREGSLLVIVGAAIDEGVHTIVARGPGSSADCGGVLKAVAASCGGRGGGRAERAEGRMPAGTDLAAIAARLA